VGLAEHQRVLVQRGDHGVMAVGHEHLGLDEGLADAIDDQLAEAGDIGGVERGELNGIGELGARGSRAARARRGRSC
jgi:hypothetical protein